MVWSLVLAGLLAVSMTPVAPDAAGEPGRARIVLKLQRPTATPSLQRIHASYAATPRALVEASPTTNGQEAIRDSAGIRRYAMVTVPESRLEEALVRYQQDPNVDLAEPDGVVHADALPNDPFLSTSGTWGQASADLWSVHRIDAPSAWERATGDGVVVAVLDTGLDYNHPDIRDNVWVNHRVVPDLNRDGRIDWRDLDQNGDETITPDEIPEDAIGRDFVTGDDGIGDADPMDENGHGTHVAGTIAATGDNGHGIIGIAWGSRVMPIRFLDASGTGSIFDAARAVVWAVDNGANVINGSWGGNAASSVLKDAFEYARDAGVVVVASAGNDNRNVGSEQACAAFPACLDSVITVAASDPDDAKVSFSNWGRAIDVIAPGGNRPTDPGVPYGAARNMLSLRAGQLGDPGLVVGDSYIRSSGTSMAAPVASAVVALIRQRVPDAGVRLVQAILEGSAADLLAPGFDIHSGFGRVDAAEAMRSADQAGAGAELVLSKIRAEPTRSGERMPIRFGLTVENIGGGAATGFDVAILDENDSRGTVTLAKFRIDRLDPGASHDLSGMVWLSGLGEHRIVARADPAAVIAEVSERNNSSETRVAIVARPFVERRISADESDQRYPTVAGHRIAWQDERHAVDDGNGMRGSDIYLYDLSTGEERRITSNPADQTEPSLSERWLAWTDYRSGTAEIRALDFESGGELAVASGSEGMGAPSLSGDRVVWRETTPLAEGDIHTKDLATGDGFRVSGQWSDSDPATADGRIVWGAGHADRYHWIHVYDLQHGSENLVPRNPTGAGFFAPSISGERFVWFESVRLRYDVWMYDLGPDGRFGTADCDGARCEGRFRLTSDPSPQWNPSISGERIAWRDHRWNTFSGDIIVLDLGPDGVFGTGDSDGLGRTEGETWITLDEFSQAAPQISGPYLVWQDFRSGNWDIYLAVLDDPPESPASLNAKRGGRGILLDWPDSVALDHSAYAVYRRSGGGAWQAIARSGASEFEDRTPEPGATYEYVVTSIDQLGVEGPVSPAARAMANRPPTIAAVAHAVADAGSPLALPVAARDPDRDSVTVVAEGLPAGAALVPAPRSLDHSGGATHVLRWTPTSAQVGTHTVVLWARDGAPGTSLQARAIVTITVSPRSGRRGAVH